MSVCVRVIVCACLGATGVVRAAEPSPELLQAWSALSHASVRVTTDDSGSFQQFDFDVTPAHDVRVAVKESARGHTAQGTLMLIADRALLAKGLPLTLGAEVDAIDGPALILQVVDQLLAATGKRPNEIHAKLALDLRETAWDLSVATASAEAEYPAPWTLRGHVEERTDGVIAFDLRHSFETEGVPVTVHYRGSWQRTATPVVFADGMPLAGWQVFTFGPMQHGDPATHMTLDFGATPLTPAPKTLGALRALLARDNGARAPR